MKKPVFKTYNKGVITQYFGGSPASNPNQYTTRGQSGHSGVDSYFTIWRHPVVADNACYVYKTINSSQSKENWQGVYMLFDMEDGMAMEIIQGHFEEIKVNKGQYIPEGAVIGLEGNRGYVFSGGVQITPAMQIDGDKRGAHTHTAYRPCQKVKSVKRGEYYLLNVTGTRYKDDDGYYYQILHKDNGYNGCINPWIYAETAPTKTEAEKRAEVEVTLKGLLIRMVEKLRGQIAAKK